MFTSHGSETLQHCEKVLAAAKQRIELIEVGNSAEKNLAPNSEEVEDPTASSGPTAESLEDDIRLL